MRSDGASPKSRSDVLVLFAAAIALSAGVVVSGREATALKGDDWARAVAGVRIKVQQALPGKPLILVTAVNTSSQPRFCWVPDRPEGRLYTVLTPAGEEVSLNRRAREPRKGFLGSSGREWLFPGIPVRRLLDLSRKYDLSAGGKYTVNVDFPFFVPEEKQSLVARAEGVAVEIGDTCGECCRHLAAQMYSGGPAGPLQRQIERGMGALVETAATDPSPAARENARQTLRELQVEINAVLEYLEARDSGEPLADEHPASATAHVLMPRACELPPSESELRWSGYESAERGDLEEVYRRLRASAEAEIARREALPPVVPQSPMVPPPVEEVAWDSIPREYATHIGSLKHLYQRRREELLDSSGDVQ